MCLKCEQFVTQFGEKCRFNAGKIPEKPVGKRVCGVFKSVPARTLLFCYTVFEGHLGRRPKNGNKGVWQKGKFSDRLFILYKPGGFKVETALGGFADFPFFYCRNRLSAYKIRFTSRCSTILHPNLPPQGACGCGASWAKAENGKRKGWLKGKFG